MASKLSGLLGGLFGGKPKAEAGPARRGEGVEYNGFTIYPASCKSGAQWRTEGVIAKELEGAVKEHHFIRADTHASREDADACAVTKAKRIIEESGERIFKDA